VLACYACGRTSGLVVDCGASGTCVSPVQDGWVESKGFNRTNMGGRYMDAHALSLLQNWRPSNVPLPHYALERFVKETDGQKLITSKPKSLKNLTESYKAYMSLDMVRRCGRLACSNTYFRGHAHIHARVVSNHPFLSPIFIHACSLHSLKTQLNMIYRLVR
jgi:hypothetical protein